MPERTGLLLLLISLNDTWGTLNCFSWWCMLYDLAPLGLVVDGVHELPSSGSFREFFQAVGVRVKV